MLFGEVAFEIYPVYFVPVIDRIPSRSTEMNFTQRQNYQHHTNICRPLDWPITIVRNIQGGTCLRKIK